MADRGADRSLLQRCLDLCSSQAEREKIRSLAVRLHLSESASEWAILLLHAEGRALFGSRQNPPSPGLPPQRIESRVLLLLGSLVAGMAVLYVGWAARSLARGG
jgi:hypothetical protein